VVPSAPTNLVKNQASITKTTASFSWTPGPSGGAFIIDYKVSYDQSIGVWVDLAENIVGTTYTAIGLTQGTEYKFKVQARNSVGFSALSDSITILTAIVPAAPAAPTTQVVANSVQITWTAPTTDSFAAYGATITAYSI
jgi:hypothetical protein